MSFPGYKLVSQRIADFTRARLPTRVGPQLECGSRAFSSAVKPAAVHASGAKLSNMPSHQTTPSQSSHKRTTAAEGTTTTACSPFSAGLGSSSQEEANAASKAAAAGDRLPLAMHWVNGEQTLCEPQQPLSKRKLQSITSPVWNLPISFFENADAKLVAAAVEHAQRAFDGTDWAVNRVRREMALRRMSAVLQDGVVIDYLARSEVEQIGRPYREMKFQLGRLGEWFDYYASLIRVAEETVKPTNPNSHLFSFTRREPLGVVAQITPWNHPLLITVKKLAPALAAGNAVVVKPSELAHNSVVKLAKILTAACEEGSTSKESTTSELHRWLVNRRSCAGGTMGAAAAASPQGQGSSSGDEEGDSLLAEVADLVENYTGKEHETTPGGGNLLPRGILSVLLGGGETGAALVSHDKITKVDFTGGPGTGRVIGEAAGKNLAGYIAELGGKSAMLVFDSPHYRSPKEIQGGAGDEKVGALTPSPTSGSLTTEVALQNVVNGVTFGCFIASGQTCIAGTRLLLQRSLKEEFLAALVKKVSEQLRVGDPMLGDTSLGPVISEKQLNFIDAQVQLAVENGAEVLCGGRKMKSGLASAQPPSATSSLQNGWFYQPTVLFCESHDNPIFHTELFGPVLAVTCFETEEEAVKLANGTKYGLGCSVWTPDLSRGQRIAEQVKAGIVWVNEHHKNDPSSPWGGLTKESGIGRENGIDAYHEYTQTKSIVMNYGKVSSDWFGNLNAKYN